MGMFDSLFAKCNCGALVEFQSKAGKCELSEYTPATVPPDVAGDLHGQKEKCKCGRTLVVKATVNVAILQDYSDELPNRRGDGDITHMSEEGVHFSDDPQPDDPQED